MSKFSFGSFLSWVALTFVSVPVAHAIVPDVAPLVNATPTPSPTPLPSDDSFVHLYHHKPMYIIWGKPDTKVQFSLKARVLKDYNLYFAYSQLMFWDFFKYSKPFHDINFNPEVFYRFDRSDVVTTDLGYEHESNGKEAGPSRSWNRIIVRLMREFPFHDDGERVLRGEFKTWYAYGLQDNRDFQHYRGQYEFNFTLQNAFGKDFGLSEVGLRFYPGGRTEINPFANGGRELSFRLRTAHSYDFFHLVVQLFEGRAEQMLDYRDHVLGARIGVGF